VDLPVIKAIRGADKEAAEQYPGTMLLLDHPTEGGGRGKPWKWSDAAELIGSGCDVILGGGLDPDNVGGALGDLGDLPAVGRGRRVGRRGHGTPQGRGEDRALREGGARGRGAGARKAK
jgi:hypothetical protein